MSKLALYGTGGFGRELIQPCLDQIASIRSAGDPLDLVFVDDNHDAPDILDIPVVPFDSLTSDDSYVIAIGDGAVREKVEARCAHLKSFDLRAHTHRRGPGSRIGAGSVFCDFTIVTASATIGRQFQCNIYSYVAHDCVIGDYVTFAPSVCCNGNVHIDDYAYIGTGAVIKQGRPGEPLIIGKGAIVGMGAVVTKSVPAGAVVVGNPATIRGGSST